MFKALLIPNLINLLTSHWLKKVKRHLFSLVKSINPSKDAITIYLRLNDPYSYLLLQVLPNFLLENPKQLNVEILLGLHADLNLEVEKQTEYALKDAERLARQNSLIFPEETPQPSANRSLLASSILLKNRNQADFLALCRQVFDSLWLEEGSNLNSPLLTGLAEQYGTLGTSETERSLDKARNDLQKKGHYQSGMLYYGGEWYWGIDRLWHLEQRLRSNKKQQDTKRPFYLQRSPELIFSANQNQSVNHTKKQVIDFYFSFRSPYSYLAIQRLIKLSEKYPWLVINIKPVLPMVMRGLKVPKTKKMYIVHDAKREAERYQIPFGKIADPLGQGIERCMALFYYAKQHAREIQFIDSVSRGIWAEGSNTASDKALTKLVTRAGLDWQEARSWLENQDWKIQTEKNRDDLNEIGLWGVPSFQFKHIIVWGQDRLWAITDMSDPKNG